MRPTRLPLRLVAGFGWLLIALVTLPAVSLAQHSETGAGSAPPPPPGPGELVVQIIADEDPGSVGGLSIALYALAPDGTPGLTNTETDASGRAVFSGLSNDPGIVYLIGARYAEIPFGERVAFAPDSKQARVEIKVSSPTDRLSGVSVDELRSRVDWMGDRIVVREILRLTSSGSRVIQLSPETNATIIERSLPPGASDFSAGPNSLGDGLELVAGKVRFRGPLYPGEQRVEYRYSLPVDASPTGERQLRLPIALREAAGRVVVVAGTSGIEVEGPGLVASREVASETGQPLASWARGALASGERIEVRMTLPESRLDPSLLSIPRSDVWIDLDDTRVNANVDLQIEVEEGPPVAGTPDAPLLRVKIPAGAKLEGVAPETEAMGLIPTADGGFDVIGPIGPGQQSISFAYRIPSRPEGVELDMRFPREVATLNVLIADTGLALDSRRLHRRRPFRSGTRNFLHREAYNVAPDEVIDLSIEPLRATGIPQQASIGITIIAVAGAALFLMAPLRKVTHSEVAEDPELVAVRDAREAVYVAIGDLDHDFETGKLEAADHSEMRQELLHEAVELLRSERALAAGATAPDPNALAAGATAPDPNALAAGATAPDPNALAAGATAPDPNASAAGATAPEPDALAAGAATPAATSAAPTLGGFCPNCGGAIESQWKFCTHCGNALRSSSAPEEPSA